MKKNLLFILIFIGFFYNSAFSERLPQKKYLFEAENATFIGGARQLTAVHGSGKQLVSLTKPEDGIIFSNLPAAGKLAIRYSSLEVGLVQVIINDQLIRQVQVHSSGDLLNSFLHSIIHINIPKNALLKISLVSDDMTVNIDQIILGEGDLGLPPDIWNLPTLPIADGPYPSDWKGLSQMYTAPEWWRDAKLGAWSHWDPQSMPEQGDWYARGMYLQGNAQYEFHLKNFGHPSEYGYKDICHNWVIDRWDPEKLMNLYVEMGARYFMAMGVHHDNFDCWDSAYQPWNSVNVGPKVDIVGTWEKIARKHGLRFGIGFHNTPPRTWGQFMSVRYSSDKSGPKKDIPYDALLTISDGKGKWWEGMDPIDLYGPVHTHRDVSLRSPFANQFMWRVDDAISNYHPDIIYFDEHAGNSQVDLGVQMGLGFLAPQLIANYYNKSLKWNNDKMEAVVNLKGVGGRWNSFQNNPELLPFVESSLVKSTEVYIEPEIMAYPFQTETSIAEWHYKTGMEYMPAKRIIQLLMENVSRNGTMLLNLTQHGRGDLDLEVINTCKDIGAWLKINGEAIYGSRPFEIYGEDSIYYTRNNGHVYAIVTNWKGGNAITLNALHTRGNTCGNVTNVEILGSDTPIRFRQNETGLTVNTEQMILPLSGISDASLANDFRVLRITHDKGWFNDDDAGVVAPGWFRQSNLGTSDFNNDLTISEVPGDRWNSSFIGRGISIIAPKEEKGGEFEVRIDGETRAIVDVSIRGSRQPQQVVFEETNLPMQKHELTIINRGTGKVAIDALIIRKN